MQSENLRWHADLATAIHLLWAGADVPQALGLDARSACETVALHCRRPIRFLSEIGLIENMPREPERQ
jgi:hypothetical protein